MTRVVTVRLDDEDYGRVTKAAQAAGQSQSSYIRSALAHEIDRDQQTARLAALETRLTEAVNTIPRRTLEELAAAQRRAEEARAARSIQPTKPQAPEAR